jgi:cytochrome b
LSEDSEIQVKVWDPYVRFSHWTVVILFTVAWFTEDHYMLAHVWSGYFIGLLVALRVGWGFIGPVHARFTDFVHGPTVVINDLKDTVALKPAHTMGHSPLAGAMIMVLLFGLCLVVGSGVIGYGMSWGAGPFGFLKAIFGRSLGKALLEVHEVLASGFLALIAIHFCGVILSSLLHGENLIWSMITGKKRR